MATIIDDVIDVRAELPKPRGLTIRRSRGDRVFFGGASLSGLIVLSIMVALGLFLAIEAAQALRVTGLWSFLTTAEWETDRGKFGISAVLLRSLLIDGAE